MSFELWKCSHRWSGAFVPVSECETTNFNTGKKLMREWMKERREFAQLRKCVCLPVCLSVRACLHLCVCATPRAPKTLRWWRCKWLTHEWCVDGWWQRRGLTVTQAPHLECTTSRAAATVAAPLRKSTNAAGLGPVWLQRWGTGEFVFFL